jgi:hypothetical protein
MATGTSLHDPWVLVSILHAISNDPNLCVSSVSPVLMVIVIIILIAELKSPQPT